MSSAVETPTPASPPAPIAPRPSALAAMANALGIFWGAAMLDVFAQWLYKFQAPAAPPITLQDLKELVPPAAISPPPMAVLIFLWALSGVGYLVGIWYALTLRKLALTPDPAAETKVRQTLGLFLIFSGVGLAILGIFLIFTLRLAGFAESVGLCLFAMIPLIAGLSLQKSETGDLVSFVMPRAEMLGRGLIGVGGAGILVFLWLALPFGKKLGAPWLPELGAIVFESLLCITAGIWLITQPAERTPLAMRILLMVLGGVTGLILTLQAFFRTILWRDNVLLRGIGGWMGSNSWEFWLCAYVGLVGLALMFGSMLLARSEVRNQPLLRQAFYGYNAVATGLLVVAFLAALNVLSFAMFPMTFEWSKGGLVSLSDATKNILGTLKNKPPVTAYVLLSQSSPAYNDTRNLLENCRAIAPAEKFIVKYVSPDGSEAGLYYELAERFPEITPSFSDVLTRQDRKNARGRGVLLVKGPLPSDPKVRPPYKFISDRRISPEGRKRTYMGEVEIIKDLKALIRDKEESQTVYVLQGNEEIPMFGDQPGELVERLRKDDYKVAGLSFGKRGKEEKPRGDVVFVEPTGADKRKEVPDDALAVLVLGPLKLHKDAREALERYMDSGRGKMLVTLRMAISKDQFVRSGIEDVLQKYGVACDINNEGYVLNELEEEATTVIGSPPPDTKNELALQFRQGIEFPGGTRVVRPSDAPGKFKAQTILECNSNFSKFYYLVDTNPKLFTSDAALHQYFATKEFERHIQEQPVPIAVAVSEEGTNPGDPTRPRLVVIGNTYFASSKNLTFDRARTAYPFLVGSLEWMSERKVEGIRPKETATFSLTPLGQSKVDRMMYDPLWMMSLGIFGLATGVWLIRRR